MTEQLILMAAYNNARFIRRQLDSILRQSAEDWRLIVRDDGSTDETRDILRAYAARDARIECHFNDSGERGAYPNFHHLIGLVKARSDYRYVVFSDADDEWREDRLERLLAAARGSGAQDLPRLYYSSFAVIDENGAVKTPDQGRLIDLRMESRWALLFHRDKVWGCTAMANRALIERVPESPGLDRRLVAHDAYLANYALVYGECVYVDEPLVFYRRHGGNASGFAQGGILRALARALGGARPGTAMAATLRQSVETLDEMLREDPSHAQLARVRRLILRGGLPAAYFCARERVRLSRWDKTLAFYTLLLAAGYRRGLSPERR